MEEAGKARDFARYRTLSVTPRWVVVGLSVSGVGVALSFLFHLTICGRGLTDNGYLYMLIALFLPVAFLIFPASKGASRTKVPWYDIFLAGLSLAVPLYFFAYSYQISLYGWPSNPPIGCLICGVILIFLVIEVARRAGGLLFAGIVFFLGTYALYASHMPGLLMGFNCTFPRLIGYHSMGTDSIIGLPMRVVGRILIGYMIFAAVLQTTGGGEFFLRLATALLGHTRGGPAKVSVLASALFGSISGSAISNVITTGAVTIPTMKSIGYPPRYAGAIEACASTGGVLMPPVMGATAFIMAEFLSVPYSTIVMVAAIPAVLYYLGLMLQVDAFAARTRLKGLPREELPSVMETLKKGWFYLGALILLIWLLLYLRWDVWAPFYASAALLIGAMTRRETRITWQKMVSLFEGIGKLLGELVPLLCSVGLIIGALTMTGVANSFAIELVELAGGNIPLLLVMGAFASFILGMGMTVTACYVVLALVLAPALVQAGIYPISAHLFVMYCGMLSYITPPVALAAFAGAGLAGAKPMETGLQAMRLGIILFLLPFFFVLNPALVLHGSPLEIIQTLSTAVLGILFLAEGMEGYLLKLGNIGWLVRVPILISGVLLAIPSLNTDIVGISLAAIILVPCLVKKGILKGRL